MSAAPIISRIHWMAAWKQLLRCELCEGSPCWKVAAEDGVKRYCDEHLPEDLRS